MTTPPDALDSLLRELTSRPGSSIQQFEAKLAEVAALTDARCIRPLLMLLNDTAGDERVFSIIHTVETFDDEIYTHHLASALPELVTAAPRWAEVLQLRILNSPETAAAFSAALGASHEDVRESAIKLLKSTTSRWPKAQDSRGDAAQHCEPAAKMKFSRGRAYLSDRMCASSAMTRLPQGPLHALRSRREQSQGCQRASFLDIVRRDPTSRQLHHNRRNHCLRSKSGIRWPTPRRARASPPGPVWPAVQSPPAYARRTSPPAGLL
ncbi:MAG: hypothetical protein K2X35_10125 [Bryobacteraceae bacterium]|nr:hypothetical protein [Bryobacteraceae bacterium]